MRYAASSVRDYRQKNYPWPWPNFTPEEIAQHENGPLAIETESMDRLQLLRTRFGRPMIVSSGYRSPAYNARVSQSGLTGAHTERGYDIRIYGTYAYELVALAFDVGFTGIGFSQAPSVPHDKRFVHLDDIPHNHPHNPRPMIWSY